MPFKLVARRGPHSGRSFPLGMGITWLGHSAEAPVPLSSPSASPRHAELEVTPNGVLLRNLDMNLGTRVNGYKVHVMLLAEGQVIEVADEVFELCAEKGEPRGTLVAVRGASMGKSFSVTDYTLTLGRIAEAQIILYTQRASRRHAEVRPMADGVHVVDLGSGNGTLVNGRRITEKRLDPGDVIEIGEEQFRFELPMKKASPSPLAMSGLEVGGAMSVSPQAASTPDPVAPPSVPSPPVRHTRSGTLEMEARPPPASRAPSSPPPASNVGVACPTCGRAVDPRYERCPWDGAVLRR